MRPVYTDCQARSLRVHIVALGDTPVGQPLSRVILWLALGAAIGTPLVIVGFVAFGPIYGAVLMIPFMVLSGCVAAIGTVAVGRVFDHNQTFAYWLSAIRSETHGTRPGEIRELVRALALDRLHASPTDTISQTQQEAAP
jgi:hypothetical protein